jgi:HPt (histidine-containing phosphotransfer) domain-containing protein
MALPAEVNPAAAPSERESPPGEACVLDLVHLSRQTLGDHALETELLALFDRQAAQIAARLSEARHSGDAAARIALVHTLKGSARAVGAFALGEAAEAYENALVGGSPDGASGEKLAREIEATRAAIAALL